MSPELIWFGVGLVFAGLLAGFVGGLFGIGDGVNGTASRRIAERRPSVGPEIFPADHDDRIEITRRREGDA